MNTQPPSHSRSCRRVSKNFDIRIRGVHILTSGTANPHLRGMDPRSIRSEDQSYSDEGFSSCTEYACPALYICTPDS